MQNSAVLRFKQAQPKHIRELAGNIREDDANETFAIGASSLESAISESIHGSHESWVCIAPEGVVCIFGIGAHGNLLDDVGCPWLLTSMYIEKHKREFLVATKIYVRYCLKQYSYLVNYIDARYVKAVRWAKWAGFTVYPAEPFGPCGLPFHKIEITSDKSNGN